MTAYKGRVVSGGRLQIPADVRKELGLADGDDVRLEVVDGELRVRSLKSALTRIRAMVREHVPPGVSLAKELIADRRAEAARD
ncbi:AbrB/MazE/SpoVT family DNA-binding domain-containing protein [Novosphingobium album (ex Liu et al. 2023)]|uniref:AbrB/MazE/SpoVT family DNA-binding domain-containing protein n=1 Tax=Novosphingobium album (ex Liu et al. 2023) TaxID=3031130 RepID=A0ABT5WWN4_9SPHN|nr:AbrB/MazE/SpoVT family DNA-binding domain-containing protein [Novosphingobium album (ex Liu et al. 2023)]MDE8654263.1 AbrB/MazE/SpoVT family DNA-binding domain-containing protein [Novosphingobium album (ex Liu et al. 2023)]